MHCSIYFDFSFEQLKICNNYRSFSEYHKGSGSKDADFFHHLYIFVIKSHAKRYVFFIIKNYLSGFRG